MELLDEGVDCPGLWMKEQCHSDKAEVIAYIWNGEATELEFYKYLTAVRLKCIRCEHLWTEPVMSVG